MKKESKTKAQLIPELTNLRSRVDELEAKEVEDRQAATALKESEERYRTAIEYSNDGFAIVQDGKHLFVNQKFLEIFGFDRAEEVLGISVDQVVHPDDRQRVMEFSLGREKGDPVAQRYEYKGIRKDGHQIYIEVSATRTAYQGKQVTLAYLRDITERKRAAEALERAEEKYRNIVENAIEGIFQSTPEGKYLMVNSAVAKFHGYDSPDEMVAAISDIRDQLYVNPKDRDDYKELLKKNGLVKGFEAQFNRKDGTIRWGSMNVRSVRDKEGHLLHYEGTIEDISARKEAEEGLQKSLEKLRKAMGGIIQAMALTVETRDPYTAGHQRRVADLARSIGQEMGLPEDQVDGLRMAGIVHDLGKISIPAEILSKPSQLSDIEFSLIKVHPQISYDILKDIDFTWPVAEIVFQHHERINGSGYPLGLAGEAIRLEARILAVADVVEAIASHRPYRPAFGIDVALEEIEKNKGILYDSRVVEVCLELFREKGFGFE